jgi:inner membrane protein
MDSLSQIALGSAVGLLAMGRRTAPWKAALWGAVAGTLPDLDVLIDHGDPIRNMVLHRAETHALFWLTLFALPFGALVARLSGEWDRWRRWCWALWLVLVTHPLLDAMTVYGTQLGLPFSNHPFGVGSVFIIDPLYTLPLVVGVVWALRRGNAGPGWRANAAGLALSTLYLGWGVLAQAMVAHTAGQALAAQGIRAEHLLVTPTPFNTLLWRVVAVDGAHYHEGFRSMLDAGPAMHFDRFERGSALTAELQGIDGVRRLQAFSRGFWALWEQGSGEGSSLGITDLRMGQEPHYSFRFAVAERHSPPRALPVAVQLGSRPDLGRGLAWLWRRALGTPLPPPR